MSTQCTLNPDQRYTPQKIVLSASNLQRFDDSADPVSCPNHLAILNNPVQLMLW